MSVRDLLRSNDERFRAVADGISADDWRRPSLCEVWSNHDVLAHLVIGLAHPRVAVAAEMVRHTGSFDRANAAMARSLAADSSVPPSYSTSSHTSAVGHAGWAATSPPGYCSAITSHTNSTSCSRSSESRPSHRRRRSRC